MPPLLTRLLNTSPLISADLFQSSSVLDYSCNPQCLPIQHPKSLPILTHLEASEHPSIQVSLTAGIPYSIILKGPQVAPAGHHRGFLDADLEPPPHPPWPSNWRSRLHGSAKWLIRQASGHPGIQASMPQVPEVGGRGGSL